MRPWEGFEGVIEEVRELDDDRVLVVWRWGGHGKTSGVNVAQFHPLGATLLEFRDERVAALTFYADADEAFADVA